MLEARGLTIARQGRTLLSGFDLSIGDGEVVGLTGPSGCGKSTLARTLAGQIPPQSGAVHFGHTPYPPRGFNPVQYVPQNAAAAMNPRWRIGRILREAHEPSDLLRAQIGVPPHWDDLFPHQLSGGQQQRVVLLRALAPQVRFLILDEISASLDAIAQAALWHDICALSQQRQLGIFAISHSAALLQRVASRVITPFR